MLPAFSLTVLCVVLLRPAASVVAAVERYEPRDGLTDVDICGVVDLDLLDLGLSLGQRCLCQSRVKSFVHEQIGSSPFLGGLNSDPVQQITDLLMNDGDQCTFPLHSVSRCTARNPCDFRCTDGFVLSSPTSSFTAQTCVCASGSVECNGQCINEEESCPSSKLVMNGDASSVMHAKRDILEDRRSISMRSVGSRLGERLGCPLGWEACGVFGGSRSSWECINTSADLESCGGCTIPLLNIPTEPLLSQTLMSGSAGVVYGTDCSTLPGVADVDCSRGSCAVHRCMPGWVVSSEGDSCIRQPRRAY